MILMSLKSLLMSRLYDYGISNDWVNAYFYNLPFRKLYFFMGTIIFFMIYCFILVSVLVGMDA